MSQENQQQRFLLRWHRHAPTITDHLPRMLDEGLFSDVTLSVNGQHLRAHRLVLASCSPYFLQIFQEADRTNIEHPFVILLNANVEDIKAILAFVYKGECCIYKNRIHDLLLTAKHLKISGLSEMEFDNCLGNQRETGLPLDTTEAQTDSPNPPETVVREPDGGSTGNKYNRDVPETCKCFVCGKYLSNQYNLRVHMETHQETYHACGSCPHVSRSRDALRKHMSYRHPDKYNARKQKKVGFI